MNQFKHAGILGFFFFFFCLFIKIKVFNDWLRHLVAMEFYTGKQMILIQNECVNKNKLWKFRGFKWFSCLWQTSCFLFSFTIKMKGLIVFGKNDIYLDHHQTKAIQDAISLKHVFFGLICTFEVWSFPFGFERMWVQVNELWIIKLQDEYDGGNNTTRMSHFGWTMIKQSQVSDIEVLTKVLGLFSVALAIDVHSSFIIIVPGVVCVCCPIKLNNDRGKALTTKTK